MIAPDIMNTIEPAAAASNYRPAAAAPVKKFTRAEIRAYIKARGRK
jgi:hypothetical protein